MAASELVTQGLAGISSGTLLFLVASGLVMIFGVSKTINFAHGSFFMLGAYFAQAMTGRTTSALAFWLSILVAGALVAAIGGLIEMLLLRRFYGRAALHQLLVTFALTMIIQDLTRFFFGTEHILGREAPGLAGAVGLFGHRVPAYSVVIVGIGVAVALALGASLKYSRWGVLMRAVSDDSTAAAALGVNPRIVRTLAFTCGSLLAGIAGALQTPIRAVTPAMDMAIITDAFAVAIIGGMGSIAGAFGASMLVGLIQAFGVVYFPKATLATPFILMALVLIVRRHGIAGVELETHERSAATRRQPTLSRKAWGIAAVAIVGLALAGPRHWSSLAAEIAIYAVFAASAQLLVATSGMVTFGHAAPFGLGAYVCALAVVKLGYPFPVALLLGILAAAAGALIAGMASVTSRSVYFAMLSLAFCEILRATAQLSELTGGDNGLLNVSWLRRPTLWRWRVVVIVVLAAIALWLLRWADRSFFGVLQRAARDNPRRAASAGVPLFGIRIQSLIVAWSAAGFAGALFALHKRSAFPDSLSTETSIQPLLMVLFGGMHSFAGGPLGAGVLRVAETLTTSHTVHWQLYLGLIVLMLLVLRPDGITRKAIAR